MSEDLVAFVSARLDEREALLRRLVDCPCTYAGINVDGRQHHVLIGISIFGLDPHELLREVYAKRQIVAAFKAAAAIDTPRGTGTRDLAHASAMGRTVALGRALQAFAAVNSGHPDYRPEWALFRPDWAPVA